MHPFFDNLVDCMTEALFLQEFSRKYHYENDQMTLLTEVSFAMQERIRLDNRKGRAGWMADNGRQEQMEREKPVGCPVCITLGSGVDAIQETYLTAGLLTEAYMVETLGSELLLKAYPQWNGWVAAQGKHRVSRYFFLGSEEQYPIEQLPELLRILQVPVTCTPAYCMLPKKSVAFYAELTDITPGMTGKDDKDFCEGICVGCSSKNCPNRMEKQHVGAYDADMTDRPFTYGYQRIFGIR